MNILKEIDKWKLEAKFEESNRYFYNIDEIEYIESGEKSYIIGRKGTGKTAISEYIYKRSSYNCFTDKLTFKNYPFNDLYELENNEYTKPNQYITLWKYLIYSTVCRMMVRNELLDDQVRSVLEEVFGGRDPITNLRRTIKQWTTQEYSIKILGMGGKLTLSSGDDNKQTWIERVDILEDIILEHMDDISYYVLFDELDEDYKDIVERGGQHSYVSLLTSLFKAVQDIRAVFFERGKKLLPVIFLRDDIYELILDPDKNKWNDFRIDLEWNIQQIKKMIAFRISKAIEPNGEILPFTEAWKKTFFPTPVGIGTQAKKKVPIFDYITRSTHLRPRDYIRYLQVAAHEAISWNQPRISSDVIKKVDKGFSNYLRDELVDEIHGVLPDIQEIFSIISEVRKQIMSIKEFREIYRQRLSNGMVKTRDPDFVLKALFHFSVIGNHLRPGVDFFRYRNKEARFNFNEKIIIHRGLFKALQII